MLKQQRVGDAGAQAAMALRRVEEELVLRNGGVGRGSPAEEEEKEERARKGLKKDEQPVGVKVQRQELGFTEAGAA